MSTQNLQSVIRELNRVRTNGQARTVVGAALTYLGRTYPVLPKIKSAEYRETSRKELDRARAALEAVFPRIPTNGESATLDPKIWTTAREAINKAYIAAEGVNGAAAHEPQTTLTEILATSIVEAPAVFAKGVGQVAGAVGDTAGSVVGGVFSGLGIVWTVVLLLVAAALVFGRLKGIV